MSAPAIPQLRPAAARNIAGSGVVLGIAGGLLLWLLGYVGPVYFLLYVIGGAIVGGLLFGVPGYAFERKVLRERQQAIEAAQAAAAAERAAALEAVRAKARAEASRAPPAWNPPAASSSSWSPLTASPAAARTPPGLGSPAGPAGAAPARPASPPSWPLSEPFCVFETNREKEVWEIVRATGKEASQVIGFTTQPLEEAARDAGLPTSVLRKISRVEGEENIDPGDLERLGNLIERHLEGGEGRLVVLPGVENLVEAGNVRNVRRLLEVVRDLAQGSHGSLLVALDPVSLPEAQVTLLERGAHKLGGT